MIIWGSKAKESQVGSGTFFCPNCKADAPYSHMRVSRYFTLYFIPLFPTSTLGAYVRCGACNVQLQDVVLQYSREQIMQSVQPWTCPGCGNRNPSSQSTCLACGSGKSSAPPPLPRTSSGPPPVPRQLPPP